MKLLANFNRANEYFDLETKIVKRIPNSPKTVGWYKNVKGGWVILLIKNSKFYISYNGKEFEIKSNYFAQVKTLPFSLFNRFTLFDKEKSVLSFKYLKNFIPVFSGSPLSAFVSREDFNWGLFLSNIINDKNKQERIIQVHSDI